MYLRTKQELQRNFQSQLKIATEEHIIQTMYHHHNVIPGSAESLPNHISTPNLGRFLEVSRIVNLFRIKCR